MTVEGFLSGFKLAPKPLKGVELSTVSYRTQTQIPIKQVLAVIITGSGLSTWLGETPDFFAHVGIKFEVKVGGETSKSIITALDLPKRLVFMVEAIGEFVFVVKEQGATVLVDLEVRRAIAPAESVAWQASLEPVLVQLDNVLHSEVLRTGVLSNG